MLNIRINSFSYRYIALDLSTRSISSEKSLRENSRVHLRKHLRTHAQNNGNDHGGLLGRRALCAVTRENDTWQFYRETHSECIYVSALLPQRCLSFSYPIERLVSGRLSSTWIPRFPSMATASRTQESVSKDMYSYYRKVYSIFCSK